MKQANIQTFLIFKPRTKAFEDMARAATRIATLLETPKIACHVEMQACLDDLLGAIYSLAFAAAEGFEDRLVKPTDPAVVLERAKQVATGKLRNDGKWIAGYHFNGALFRLAAVYHRSLKVVSGRKVRKKSMVADLLLLVPFSWTAQRLAKIHNEVNSLKHTPDGVAPQRTVTFAEALAASGELLDLIEEWERRP